MGGAGTVLYGEQRSHVISLENSENLRVEGCGVSCGELSAKLGTLECQAKLRTLESQAKLGTLLGANVGVLFPLKSSVHLGTR